MQEASQPVTLWPLANQAQARPPPPPGVAQYGRLDSAGSASTVVQLTPACLDSHDKHWDIHSEHRAHSAAFRCSRAEKVGAVRALSAWAPNGFGSPRGWSEVSSEGTSDL